MDFRHSVRPFVLAGASMSMVLSAVAMGVALLVQLVLARLLGVDDYGRYTYVLIWANVLVFGGKLGWDTAALRFLPAYAARGESQLFRAFVRRAQRLSLWLSSGLALLIALALLALATGNTFDRRLLVPGIIAAAVIPIYSLTLIWSSVAQAAQKIIVAQGIPNIVRPALLALSLSIFALIGATPTATTAMVLTLGCGVLALFLVRRSAGRVVPIAGREDESQDRLSQEQKAWESMSYAMFLISTATVLCTQIDLMLLGVFYPATDVGAYAAAVRLTSLIPFATVAANAVMAPTYSRLSASGDFDSARAAVKVTAQCVTAVALVLFIAIVSARELLLNLFGTGFAAGAPAVLVLAVGKLVLSVAGLGGYLLSMTGNHNLSAWIAVVALVLEAATCLLLIPQFGMLGAAAGALVGSVVIGGASTVACIRLVKINPTIIGRW